MYIRGIRADADLDFLFSSFQRRECLSLPFLLCRNHAPVAFDTSLGSIFVLLVSLKIC